MASTTKTALFWHRRDLRVHDNAGLYKALQSGCEVLPVFIFDTNILDKLPANDARVAFIHAELRNVKTIYEKAGSSLVVKYGEPEAIWQELITHYSPIAVYTNRDYEPYAKERDARMKALFDEHGIDFIGSKDHVIFEKCEVTKDDGKPYTVFTPYMKKWKSTLTPETLAKRPSEQHLDRLLKHPSTLIPTLTDMGFEGTSIEFPPKEVSDDVLLNYGERRDLPAIKGTSRLSVHLRFGTVSIRELVQRAQATNEKWLNELIWRDFYQMILHHFPHSASAAFKPAYDKIPWRSAPDDFARWCEGTTGYPIVDAGMRELNATGFMHNRVRMVVASFLTKHLLIDWRLGERYFAEKLLDFDLASNVGGWQWAAGSGCDAAPYFRVFNPTSQQEKFDPDMKYIRKWVPELNTPSYPKPMVDHALARKRAIDTYKAALG